MIATSQSTGRVIAVGDGRRDRGDTLRMAAQRLLRASSYGHLRRLGCEVIDGILVLTGVVPSYYLKQVAQEMLQHLAGVRRLQNRIEVRRAEGARAWNDEPLSL